MIMFNRLRICSSIEHDHGVSTPTEPCSSRCHSSSTTRSTPLVRCRRYVLNGRPSTSAALSCVAAGRTYVRSTARRSFSSRGSPPMASTVCRTSSAKSAAVGSPRLRSRTTRERSSGLLASASGRCRSRSARRTAASNTPAVPTPIPLAESGRRIRRLAAPQAGSRGRIPRTRVLRPRNPLPLSGGNRDRRNELRRANDHGTNCATGCP
jgi:hypothetical protein